MPVIATVCSIILGLYYIMIGGIAAAAAAAAGTLNWSAVEIAVVNIALGVFIIAAWWSIAEVIASLRRCGHIT